MNTGAAILSILLAALFLGAGGAKLAGSKQTNEAAAHLGVPRRLDMTVGALEVAAAVGLVIGFWMTWLGVAASIGLVLMMIGAVGFHLRAGDSVQRFSPPAALGVLAAINAVLLIA
ncbi:DoxX-like family protein [Amycolatopsis marina]|uniref:DoxX-like family protein n=1 Tax=Amycolatopsis marina TaxID=490629 RepID=A0A1I0VHJ5_9PSEU|nr:DoxX family protein [Amycolatopsis marina]SFA75969.1 DoxX-like family protein [Amycolatopsis marina]